MLRGCICIFQRMFSSFKFSDYDVIGFDLDNTLLHYNLTDLFKLQYEFLTKYFIEKKGYKRNAFPVELTDQDADFFQRGLFLDCSRGNVLHLRHDGFILKASHGTSFLEDYEIESVYGKERKWEVIDKFVDNKLSLWDCEEARTFLDFTDSIATLIFAKAVDAVDKEQKCDKYTVWPDLLEAIIEMYKSDSDYILTINSDLFKYLISCDQSIITWLRTLKTKTKVILITGAEQEVAEITLPLCLGPDYKEFFDLIIYHAKKPGFFTMKRNFYTLDGKETDNISIGNAYKHGNWTAVYELFKNHLGREPKCVYVGDNPVQDIYAPTVITQKLDTVAVIEEVASEGLHPEIHDYPHSKYVSSKCWGSYLDSGYTLSGDILRTSAKLVIPSLRVVVDKPINYEHKSVLNHNK